MNFYHLRHFLWIILFGLAGCASTVDCDVLAYHELGKPAGETVRLVHRNPDDTYGPAFTHYAKDLTEVLNRIGYVVTQKELSDLTFVVDYGITIGSSEIEETNRCSTRYHFINRNYDDPYIYRDNCEVSQIRTRTFYVHFLDVAIQRFVPINGQEETLYEGRVYSNHHRQDMPEMMPYLITAMFDNFPSESGVVKSVTFEQKKIDSE